MRAFILAAIAAMVALPLTACSTAGSGDIDWNKVAALQPGQSRAEVEGAIGRPYMASVDADGNVQLIWVNSDVNMFTGSVASSSLKLSFDKDGHLIKVPPLDAIRR